MERINLSISEFDANNFERGCKDAGMSKSAYMRLLIAEHEARVPASLKYREIIAGFSELNTEVRRLVLTGVVSEKERAYIIEKFGELREAVERLVGTG